MCWDPTALQTRSLEGHRCADLWQPASSLPPPIAPLSTAGLPILGEVCREGTHEVEGARSEQGRKGPRPTLEVHLPPTGARPSAALLC